MKRLFLFLFIICFIPFIYGQKVYTFYIETAKFTDAPKFVQQKGKLVYAGSNSTEAAFFSNYTILEFYQSFTNSKRERTLNFFTVSTLDQGLMDSMLQAFPSKYLFAEDITNINYELANSYPNDYGSTSPVTNLGVNASLKNLDYINAPKAWDYTTGSSSVILGISDGQIDVSDIDLSAKTTFINAATTNVSHGTTVTAIAAAQGNNGHGMTGVCQDCSVIGTRYGDYDNLLALADIDDVRVINMSWIGGYSEVNELVINEIYDKGIILVAGSGNTSLTTNPNIKYYPASYDHVISVLTVNHRNKFSEEVVNDPTFGEISRFVVDMISPSVVTNYQGNGPYGFASGHTANAEVDICAPGYRLFRYYPYVESGAIEYQEGGGTSSAAPHVTGAIGLMVSAYDCITGDEAEDIIQLTSKNLEIIQGNEPFIGKSGAGKLEVGDAVEFVHEMTDINGNALIDGQDFYRFKFDLNRINNKLTISNQTFRDSCIADFTARNIIDVLPGSDFKPNNSGEVDLKIDQGLVSACITQRPIGNNQSDNQDDNPMITLVPTKLFPNPNNGTFEIQVGIETKGEIGVEVYDIYGKIVYRKTEASSSFNVNIDNLASGMYIVKLSYNGLNETLKFIKK